MEKTAKIIFSCALLLSTVCLGRVYPANAAVSGWNGIGPDGGQILTLAIDPVTPQTLYAGTGYCGVYKSLNGGGSWMPAQSNLPVTNRKISIAVASGTFYPAIKGGGVYKNINGGL